LRVNCGPAESKPKRVAPAVLNLPLPLQCGPYSVLDLFLRSSPAISLRLTIGMPRGTCSMSVGSWRSSSRLAPDQSCRSRPWSLRPLRLAHSVACPRIKGDPREVRQKLAIYLPRDRFAGRETSHGSMKPSPSANRGSRSCSSAPPAVSWIAAKSTLPCSMSAANRQAALCLRVSWA